MHIPELIADLALMLIVAGITTLVFKKIHQPVVLGYIIAGFLISPYFTFLPTVQDTLSIHTWSEIGIIVLMFSLGLEFNLHKLASVGNTAIITAITEVVSMLAVGFGCGQLMGWSVMDSVFLGGMLSMSSTTIIIKAFEDLKLRKEKFTELVFGSLIIEDIAGIFMMVILSTIAVSKNISGGELTASLFQMILYLILWLLLGIYLIPSFLKKTKGLMNDETLLIVSLAICFGMVMLAAYLGFSTALGAFLAGSLLAGTLHAEQIEHLSKPIKDLFGAVFFISVGMMVDPKLIVEYALPILILTLITIFIKAFFSTLGVVLSGQPLQISIRCGCSLAQIGEFSFIIATLGISLGVMSEFIYPIIVSVSVITTITTPYIMRSSDGLIRLAERILPNRLIQYLSRHTAEDQSEAEHDGEWTSFIKKFFSRLVIYGSLMIGIVILGITWVRPWMLARGMDGTLADTLSIVIILLGIAPFANQCLKNKNQGFLSLWFKRKANHLPLLVLTVLRLAIMVLIIMAPLYIILDLPFLLVVAISILIIFLIARSDWLIAPYLRMEAQFLSNLNERQLAEQKSNATDHHWLDEEYYVAKILCDREMPMLTREPLKKKVSTKLEFKVIKIIRNKKHINIPKATDIIHIGDEVHIAGTGKQLKNLEIISKAKWEKMTLHEYIISQEDYGEEDQLLCFVLAVKKNSGLAGVRIKDSPIKNEWGGLLLGVERELLPILAPDINFRLQENDLIWLLGTQKTTGKLAKQELI